ncbi:MAG: class I SAM-dependent methyltransferase [Candidatus Solibacter usitatus]|nr:class I SAM-dependent methyltransferase [Candidatus Solibacter usitatus]
MTAYRLLQTLLAPGARRRLMEQSSACNQESGRRLDVGCGPDRLLNAVGVDIDFKRIAAYARSGWPGVVASATALPFRDGTFGGVWSCGLLHHLNDEEARQALSEMRRVGRRTVVLDGVPPEPRWRRPVAALIRRLDRGSWLRSEARLRALAGEAWTCRRITYSLTGLEGLVMEGSNADRR